MKTYVGIRDEDGATIVVKDSATGAVRPLPPCNDLVNHSPDGFEWGYGGSGPAQASLAIMVSHLADERHHAAVMAVLGINSLPSEDERLEAEPHKELAMRYYQQFKFRVVGSLPREGWELTEEDIERLIIETNKRPQVTA